MIQFPTFVNKVKLFVHGRVDFSENDIAAEKDIYIAINSNGFDPQTQSFRLEQLEQAFFNDLAKVESRFVITLDHYEKAIVELKDWIESKWLRAVERQLKNVSTVIAGQTIPNHNNSVWGDGCEHFPLKAINLEDWCKFCPDLPKEAIKAIVLVCEGHPANVQQMLSLAIDGW